MLFLWTSFLQKLKFVGFEYVIYKPSFSNEPMRKVTNEKLPIVYTLVLVFIHVYMNEKIIGTYMLLHKLPLPFLHGIRA